jgi:putative acetyltransferase
LVSHIKLIRTNSDNADFQRLIVELDAHLEIINGMKHAFYSQFNTIDKIHHVVVAYTDDIAVGCGAIKKYTTGTVEVKRMFVKPEYRGHGIAGRVLHELERWAVELNCATCILETGTKLSEAIGLYKKHGYGVTENYPPYVGSVDSVCFRKEIKSVLA